MRRLTAMDLKGVWAGVTMSWDEDLRLDEEAYRANIERMIHAGVHGVYTTGSTGEFYAVEYEEFCRMVDIQAELCGKAETPLQIGCCADATNKVIRLLEYAAKQKQVGAAQVALPYWMELTDREVLQFFKDLYAACPDLPLVHYNIPRTKRFLHGPDYQRILEVAPNLIGVKYTMAGGHFSQLQNDIQVTPSLSYFVGENLLVSAMQLGVRGTYSSLIATNPQFMLNLYSRAADRNWDEAIRLQTLISRFFLEIERFVEDRHEGVIDPVFDKGLAVASGCFIGHQRCRPPYLGWSDETVKIVGEWLQERYPMFVYC